MTSNTLNAMIGAALLLNLAAAAWAVKAPQPPPGMLERPISWLADGAATARAAAAEVA